MLNTVTITDNIEVYECVFYCKYDWMVFSGCLLKARLYMLVHFLCTMFRSNIL